MLVLTVAAALVALGYLLRLPGRVLFGMLGVLWVATLMAHALLPAGHALPAALGGSLRGWAVAGAAGALALGYGALLGLIRRRVRPASVPVEVVGSGDGPFGPGEIDRYARHIVLREIGGMGQRRLKEARVLVVGAGGLGSPLLLYLAAAGVGRIAVVDDDHVALSNLQRQIIHREADIGAAKVRSAAGAMAALNRHGVVEPLEERLTAARAAELFPNYDLILDGSDNFDTRYLVNRAAVAALRPLIAGAITQWEGQISLYDPAHGAPCYACIFPDRPAEGLAPSCAEAGVMGALPGVVGAMMAVEAIKAITGAGETLRGRMLLYDALYGETRQITLKRSPSCPICGEV